MLSAVRRTTVLAHRSHFDAVEMEGVSRRAVQVQVNRVPTWSCQSRHSGHRSILQVLLWR